MEENKEKLEQQLKTLKLKILRYKRIYGMYQVAISTEFDDIDSSYHGDAYCSSGVFREMSEVARMVCLELNNVLVKNPLHEELLGETCKASIRLWQMLEISINYTHDDLTTRKESLESLAHSIARQLVKKFY